MRSQPHRSEQRLLVATRSRHKLGELRALLHLPDAVLVDLDDVGIDHEVDETARTFRGNAILKARTYAALAGLPTLADDSGLEVDALGGGPGVRTKRYAGEDATDAENNAKLLAELTGLPPARRGARYVCVLAYLDPAETAPDARPWVVTRSGTLRGRIAVGLRGAGGFGYDPLFEPLPEPPGGRTVGEMRAEEKNAISHRARAARAMARHLRTRDW
ncbi:MAG: non-canonical purine NTP pyrophosphatase [Chloroflexota bacterium]